MEQRLRVIIRPLELLLSMEMIPSCYQGCYQKLVFLSKDWVAVREVVISPSGIFSCPSSVPPRLAWRSRSAPRA